MKREEATDPAALPAGVSHEGGVGPDIDSTETTPGPLWAPRVLVMTPGLHPATGVGAGLLHQVEHLPAEDRILYVPLVLFIVTDGEISVQLTGIVPLPLGAELGLVLHPSRPSRPRGEPRGLGQGLIIESTVQYSTVQYSSTVQ